MEKKPTKERILYSALDLFAEFGYDGVGIDQIAEDAGIKGPSCYKHFKGKEDIFNSLIDMVEKHYSDGFGLSGNTIAFPTDLNELYEFSLKKIDFTLNDEIIQKTRKILSIEQFRNKRMAKLASEHQMDGLLSMFTAVFSVMIRNGLIKDDDPELLALEYLSPVSLLIQIYDRQSERKEEIIAKIEGHIRHFIKIYGESNI